MENISKCIYVQILMPLGSAYCAYCKVCPPGGHLGNGPGQVFSVIQDQAPISLTEEILIHQKQLNKMF